MDSKPTNLEELFEKLKDYAEIRLDLFKLKSINKIAGFTSSVITIVILTVLLSGVILCLTIGIALLIGSWLGNAYYGFFIVGGIYLIAGLVIYSMRDKLIKSKISNKLIKELID
jgi:hypothetical protein